MTVQTLPISTRDALDRARRRGRVVGCDTTGFGSDCPYSFEPIDLRYQWFAGFSEGRALMRREVGDADLPGAR